MRVRSNGVDIEVESFGDPAAPPVLLVMGLTMQMVAWDEAFCALLVDRGYRVLRFDNRDIGLSSRLSHLGVPRIAPLLPKSALGMRIRVPYTVADMAQDALGVLDALDLPGAHIVGASMGGMIAQRCAIAAPERVLSLTSIMSTTGSRRLPLPNPRALSMLLKRPPREPAAREAFAVEVYTALQGGTAVDVDRLRARHRISFARASDTEGGVRQFAAVLAEGDRTKALRQLTMPVAVAHGRQDPLVRPAAGHATAAAIPDAELLLLDQMGHGLPPRVWAPLADLIDRTARRAP